MNQTLLRDKVALVTGAANGIGESIVHLFAENGAHVYVLDIDSTKAGEVAAAVQSKGGSAVPMTVDVSRAEPMREAAADAIRRFGHIDVLINNAGIYPRRLFLEMTEEEWDQMHNVNLKGVFHCTKAVLPHMVSRGAGKIVNISSVTFHRGTENLSHYVAAKGGVIGLTRSLAREMGPGNIHVNCVTPGAIEVEMERKVATLEQMAAIQAQQSLQRRLQPIDVARVCLFLSSDLSDGMTGQTLNVDGGWVMY